MSAFTEAVTSTSVKSNSLAAIVAAVNEWEKQGIVHPQELRISILRNYTVDSLVTLLKYQCYSAGFQPCISVGDYDSIRQEVLDPGSHVYSHAPDIIITSMMLEHLDPSSAGDGWDESSAEQAVVGILTDLVERTSALLVVNTFLPPLSTENELGGCLPTHRLTRMRRLNETIREFGRNHARQVYVADWERMLQAVGEAQALDYRFWYMYKSPFKIDFLSRYSRFVLKAGRVLKGKAKKCLVLDCDNTLWGGIVGEDGVTGIALDRNEFPGRCFYDFQQSVLNLIEQGVIVALCSKNNEEDVWEVLDRHPHSLLRRSHIAAWRINWENKAANIAALATELNLGLDSFVFVDDSETECQLVRDLLPEVTVLQAPKKSYELPRLLFDAGLFDTLGISAEDRDRTQMYVAERERTQLKEQVQTIDEYLQSLNLRAAIGVAADSDLARVAQLVGKTNQFNLTTHRYTSAEISALAHSPDSKVFTLTASDRFGDLGLVGVLIARRNGKEGSVDSLLLSCRALGRRLELVFVDRCLTALEQEWGVEQWTSAYFPTKKNRQVEQFWDSLGFKPEFESATEKRYRVAASQWRPARTSCIEVVETN